MKRFRERMLAAVLTATIFIASVNPGAAFAAEPAGADSSAEIYSAGAEVSEEENSTAPEEVTAEAAGEEGTAPTEGPEDEEENAAEEENEKESELLEETGEERYEEREYTDDEDAPAEGYSGEAEAPEEGSGESGTDAEAAPESEADEGQIDAAASEHEEKEANSGSSGTAAPAAEEIIEPDKKEKDPGLDNMPEFNAEKKAGKYIVKIHADEGVLPKRAMVSVKEMKEEEAKPYAEKAEQMADSGMAVAVIDITFKDFWGREIQPTGMVEVTFENAVEEYSTMSVYHAPDGDAEKMEEVRAEEEDDAVSFRMDSFSPFVLLAAADEPNWTSGGAGTQKDVSDKVKITSREPHYYTYDTRDYGSWTTCSYDAKLDDTETVGNTVCMDPRLDGEVTGVTGTKVYEMDAPMLVKAFYYGAYGPGSSTVEGITGTTDIGANNIVTHVAAAEIYARLGYGKSGSGDGFKDTTEKLQEHVRKFVKAIEGLSTPGNYYVYIVVYESGKQDFGFGSFPLIKQEASFSIEKTINAEGDVLARIRSNSNYEMEGARFGIYKENGTAEELRAKSPYKSLTVQKNGKTADCVVPPGTYYIVELKAPQKGGFIRSNSVQKVTLSADEAKELEFQETPVYVYLRIIKEPKDIPEGTTPPSLEGAVFNIYRNTQRRPEDLVGTLTTGADGKTEQLKKDLDGNDLPAQNYYVTEVQPPEGYNAVGNFSIDTSDALGSDKRYTLIDRTVLEPSTTPTHVGITVVKRSGQPAITDDNACYPSLAGAKFGIYSDAECQNLVEEIVTDETGRAVSGDTLAAGDYWIRELEAPEGYNINEDIFPVSSEEIASGTQELIVPDTPKTDPANITIEKRSADGKEGDLSGAEFTFSYYKGYLSESELASVSPERSWTIRTKEFEGKYTANFRTCIEDGTFVSGDEFYLDSAGNPAFPLGTVTIRETKAPAGYLNDPDFGNGASMLIGHIEPDSDGKANFVVISGSDPVANTIIVEDEEEIEDVPSISTSAVDAATKTHSADAGSGTFRFIDTVTYRNLKMNTDYTVSGTLMDKGTGKPFRDSNGNEVTASSEFNTGNTVYGSVEVAFEFECDEDDIAGHTLVVTEVLTADDDGKLVAEHSDLNDAAQTIYITETPEIRTLLLNKEDNTHYVPSDSDIELEDTIVYEGLTTGMTYIATGTLMDRETGKALRYDGKDVTATVSFRPEKSSGAVSVTFTFNTAGLGGKFLVAYEELSSGGIVVAEHKDLSDEGQTVEVTDNPSGGTLANDSETMDHIAKADEQVTILDEVTYTQLNPGEEYEITGTLMDKESNSPLMAGGSVVSVTEKFTPSEADGTHTMSFTLNASKLKGKDVVVFEVVKDSKGDVAFSHEEISDAGQTIHFPDGRTTAEDKATGSHTARAAENVTITDEVVYSNLIAGKEYTVSGVMMDKETGKPVLIDGRQVTAEKTFTAAKKDGSVTLEFTFDSSKLGGKSIVAFETVEYNGKEVFVHADINDEDQTVNIPKVGTSLRDAVTGTKFAKANADTELVDTVSYSNVTVGDKYTVNGVLMDKATGEPLEIGGKQVTATASFTAEKESGTVNVTFKLNTKSLDGRSLVAFEELVCGGEVVAEHKEIGDEGQTVVVPAGKTTAKDSETLDHIAKADEQVTITDDVEYYGLEAGKEYEITGMVADRAEADPEAKPLAVVTEKFTPKASDGTYQMKFTFNASALKGKDTVVFETVRLGSDVVFDHKDINDADQTIHFPDGRTTAEDKATGSHTARVTKSVTVTDEVVYSNLIAGKEYKASGVLMDKATGKPLLIDGKQVTAEKTFTAEKKDGSITLEFTFDSSALAGRSAVAFETVTYKDKEVFVHADLSDEDQTVHFPKVGTKLRDSATKQQIVLPGGTVTLVDTVSYSNVTVGDKYTVNGVLMDKATGKPLEAGGKQVTATASFTAEKESGTVDVTFTFDAKGLDGKTLVAYEELACGGEVVAEHKEIGDAEQTVYTPSGKTTATDSETSDHIANADKSVTISDAIEYHNLIPGKEYTVTGKLMDKATGKPVVSGGKEVTVTERFTPSEADGTHTMTFTFDGTGMRGKGAVVFETVQYEGADVFVHADIKDKDQTVEFPDGGTTAKDAETGSHTARVAKSVTVRDEVVYKNLLAGKEYKVSGVLMDKATNKPLTVGGKQVTAEKTFTADKADGSVVLEFTFDSSALEGRSAVAFETITYKDKEVFVHADLNDKDQTVNFPKVGTFLENAELGEQFAPADSDVELVDTVSYDNVTVGDRYTVNGTLMDKATGKALERDGRPVTASAEFTAEKESGTIEVTFKFNTAGLKGGAVVAFEELVCNGKVVAEHREIGDAGQTVTVPDVTTDAAAERTKEKTMLAHEDEVILDDVTYTGLIANREYAVSGTVKVQEQGKNWGSAVSVPSEIVSVNANGNGTAKIENGKVLFTPAGHSGEVISGTITIGFKVDASDLAGEKLVVGETVEYNGKEIAVHADLHDDDQTVYVPDGRTEAVDTMTGIKNTLAADGRIFKDTFTYENLEIGKEYIFTGEVATADRDENGDTVKDENGNVIVRKIDSVMVHEDGTPVEDGCFRFTPEAEDGQIELYFMVDATELANREVTVFEDVTRNGELIIVHHVLDGSQTVYVPEGATTAVDSETKDQVAMPDEDVTIIDMLVYKNLIPGKAYTVKGRVMRKDTVEEVPSELTAAAFKEGSEGTVGSVEESVVTFTPAARDGYLELTFVFNASELKGEDVVVFERVYHNGSEVIIHENINDEAQTVHFPDGRTNATDPDTDDRTMKADRNVKIRDEFVYENLLPGKQYVITGKAMLRPVEAEEPQEIAAVMVDADGNEIAEHVFTPESRDGSEYVYFVIDASELAGRSVVMYETMDYINSELGIRAQIVRHEDIDDEDETIHFPDGGTTAVDSETGSHTANADEEVTVLDEVVYRNLIPGKTYTVTGTLMDKETGRPVMSGGREVTAQEQFTPEAADGSVVVGFTFDGTGLAGRSVVAFETVTCEGKEVFVHADLDDRDQTVNFPEVRTNATDMKDGDHEISYEGTVTVVDSVEYRNLTPGAKYLVSGVLMDKSAGKAANAGGEITGETEFTAKEKDGTVKVSFNFDSTKLKEGSYVVFETLYEINDKTGEKHVVGTHWDLEDDAQTVSRPKTPTPPGTSARTGDDSSMAVWAIALTAAFAGLAGAVIYGRKRFGR